MRVRSGQDAISEPFRRSPRSWPAVYTRRLDAVLGDGDHGDNPSTGFRSVEELLPELPAETPPGDLLR